MRITLAMAFGLLTFVGVLCFLATTTYETPGLFVALAITVMFPAMLLAMILHGDANQRVFAVGALVPMVLLLVSSRDVFEAMTLNPMGDKVYRYSPYGPPAYLSTSPSVTYMADVAPSLPANPTLPPSSFGAPPPPVGYAVVNNAYWRLSSYARPMIDRTWSFAVLSLLAGSAALVTKTLLRGKQG